MAKIYQKPVENNITIEKVFRGKRGDLIMIQRYGMNDYCAVFGAEFSVRGTLIQILREIQNEIPEGVF